MNFKLFSLTALLAMCLGISAMDTTTTSTSSSDDSSSSSSSSGYDFSDKTGWAGLGQKESNSECFWDRFEK